MDFRSYGDLAQTLHSNLWRVPADVDLIVSVPRSGIIPGTMLALSLNLPTTDVEGLIERRLNTSGQTRRFRRMPICVSECSHALVVDDSILSGNSLLQVKRRISAADLPLKVSYAAVYAAPASAHLVDVYFEVCPLPRVFEWNFLHHSTLSVACADIEGVLSFEQLQNLSGRGGTGPAPQDPLPQLRPSHRIHHLVASRPEDHRPRMEAWLRQHQIEYDRLTLIGAVRELSAGAVKGALFKADHHAKIFIAGRAAEAPAIAAVSGKPVICVGNQRLYRPSPLSAAHLQHRARRLRHRMLRLMSRPWRQFVSPVLRDWSIGRSTAP